ncbi:amidohydrolase family protein [Haliea sp. E17]|uniref:amidohydrolase family protein n=1 Tax=Haliea sp. E17 TaxID=3401576 RepID=UPI003AB07EB0
MKKVLAALVASALIGAPALAAAAAPQLLLTNATLITVDPDQPDAFSGYMQVGDDGRIMAIGAGKPPAEISAPVVRDMGGKMVAPGFISAHSHIYMSPLRGLGHDVNLYGWFRAWDYYLRHTTADDIYWFTLHGSVDFLRNGITTAYDFTYPGVLEELTDDPSQPQGAPTQKPGPFEENQIRAKLDSGMRFINSPWLSEIGSDDDIIGRFGDLLDWAKKEGLHDDPQYLADAISGQQQFMPTDRTAKLEVRAMREFGVMNQSHFLESPNAVPEQQAKFAWYDDAGALGPDFIFGHFIHVNDAILDRVVESGARMSWQPTSNGRLADGIADVVRYRELGIPVAVGLDDQSCTDVSDPFQNLRIGLYTMRGLHKKASALSIQDMLYLHTLDSAKVLNIEDKVGSLEVGKFADFLVVDPRSPDTGPVYEPLATYVLAASLRNLKEVWVGGEQVVNGTDLLTYDEAEIRREIDQRTDRIRAEAAAGDLEKVAAAGN